MYDLTREPTTEAVQTTCDEPVTWCFANRQNCKGKYLFIDGQHSTR